MVGYQATLGLEEEFFLLEKGRLTPTLQSLDYLRRLTWMSPRKHFARSASNFAKGEDRKQCFMGSVELSTSKHESPASLVQDLIERRTDFAIAAEHALIVPVGQLFTLNSPSNTASSHIHVGVPPSERKRVYENLAYFTPVLATASANSPFAAGKSVPLSYRMASEGLLGPLREDSEFRFQDLIISKRLGTIEMRIFDPIPELDRLTAILEAVQAIAQWPGRAKFDRDEYNRLRPLWTSGEADLEPLKTELAAIVEFDTAWTCTTYGSILTRAVEESGDFEAAYRQVDQLWRAPTEVVATQGGFSSIRAATGLLGYYLPKLPYMAFKGYKEWYGKT